MLTDLVAASGGRVERDRRLIGFRQERDGVVVQVAGPRGSEEIRAAWVVGADGGRSTVRRTLGLPFRGTGADLEETIVLADVLLDRDLAPDRIYSWFNEDGALLAFPFTEPGRWRLTAALSPEELATGRFTDDSLDRFTELYRRRTGDATTRLSDMQGFSVYRVNQRVVDHYRRGRVVLAGDAAHVHTPAGGLGMNTGIQDAYSLGWRLALALDGGDDGVVDDVRARTPPDRGGSADQHRRPPAPLRHPRPAGAARPRRDPADAAGPRSAPPGLLPSRRPARHHLLDRPPVARGDEESASATAHPTGPSAAGRTVARHGCTTTSAAHDPR